MPEPEIGDKPVLLLEELRREFEENLYNYENKYLSRARIMDILDDSIINIIKNAFEEKEIT